MNFKPLFNKILVRQENNQHTIGGLIIPDTATNLKKGVVIEVGDNVSVVVKGGSILFSKDAGTLLVIDGEQYLVMEEKDVWLLSKN